MDGVFLFISEHLKQGLPVNDQQKQWVKESLNTVTYDHTFDAFATWQFCTVCKDSYGLKPILREDPRFLTACVLIGFPKMDRFRTNYPKRKGSALASYIYQDLKLLMPWLPAGSKKNVHDNMAMWMRRLKIYHPEFHEVMKDRLLTANALQLFDQPDSRAWFSWMTAPKDKGSALAIPDEVGNTMQDFSMGSV